MANPEPTDEDCITQTASGDSSGFATLWRRHSATAYAVARSYRTLDADDLVAESFAKVLRAILNGGGPDTAFRAYLIATLRNTAATQLKRTTTVSIDRDLDLETVSELSIEGPEPLADGLAARAFEALPRRWQQVLWHVGVEGLSPAEAAPMLGLTPNGVSALAMRARKRFRRELVLVACAELPSDSPCRPALLAKVGSVGEPNARAAQPITGHAWQDCSQCRSILGETGAASPSLTVTVFVAAIGAGTVPALIELGTSTATAVGDVVPDVPPPEWSAPSDVSGSVVPLPGTEGGLTGLLAPSGSPAALIAAPTTLLPVKVTVLAAGVVAAFLAFSFAAPTEAPANPSPEAQVEQTTPPIDEPPLRTDEPAEDLPATRPSPADSPSPDEPPPAPEQPAEPAPPSAGLANRAAPQFTLVSDRNGVPRISGLGTPGWTVQAFVADGLAAFALAESRVESPADEGACPRPPNGERATTFSTGPLTRASWTLAFADLAPGNYTAIVVECALIGDELRSSVFSEAVSFVVAPPQ